MLGTRDASNFPQANVRLLIRHVFRDLHEVEDFQDALSEDVPSFSSYTGSSVPRQGAGRRDST